MRKTTFAVLLLVTIAAIVAVNCGGDSGNKGVYPADLKLSTTGTGTIGAIDVTVQLPDGVRCRNAAPSGVAAAANPLIAVNNHAPGEVRIGMITVIGFGMGEFCTMNCDIASGLTPSAADFLTTQFKVFNSDGRTLAGIIAPVVSVEMH